MWENKRQAVADRLHAAVAEGHLSLEEFSDRIGAAYAATTPGELVSLLADLPPPAGPERSAGAAPVGVGPAGPVLQRTPVGAIKRGGRWRLDEDTELRTVLGTVKLDLYGAQLGRSEVTLSVRTLVGTIKVWVPPGLRVVVDGHSTIGSRHVQENHLPPDVPAPTLRLRLDTVVGSVKVYRG
jgi:hypothetical protein